MVVHGCRQSEHANDTIAHYNRYRQTHGLESVTCDPESQLVTFLNGSIVKAEKRCIMHVVEVAAWKPTHPPTTLPTSAHITTPDLTSATTTPKPSTHTQEKKSGNAAVIVVAIIAGIAGIAALVYLAYKHNETRMLVIDENPVYEIPVNTTDANNVLYDNITTTHSI